MNSETVEISKNTLVELVRSHLIFNALTYGGVDNWGGYGENFNEEKAEILNYLPEIREEFCKEGYCEDLEDMPSFREIAQKLNISRSYVSRIEKKDLKKLKKELKLEKSLI